MRNETKYLCVKEWWSKVGSKKQRGRQSFWRTRESRDRMKQEYQEWYKSEEDDKKRQEKADKGFGRKLSEKFVENEKLYLKEAQKERRGKKG